MLINTELKIIGAVLAIASAVGVIKKQRKVIAQNLK
ncbi:hypothetical protein MM817_03092 [Acidibacillus sp. S0AB]|uniref:Uncharacterized protein n=1 Tax=Sulfoacidibacillus ferrooxidans TaxID=2005001 RepID=A0A9X2AEP9_9BACL|nr:hypothetical protein [Sulfoacidibacillus ferrooxidans]